MYAITRLKAARNAWYWVVHLQRRGKRHHKRFYDLKHGGSRKALAAALKWRDRVLATTKALSFREFHQHRRSNNTSGVAGVHFLRSLAQPLGIWQARIKLPNGGKVHRSFSVRKFGERQAFRRAVDARAQMLELVADRPYLYDPIAKKFATGSGTKRAPR